LCIMGPWHDLRPLHAWRARDECLRSLLSIKLGNKIQHEF
jgi:hypothetical protein